MSKRESPPKLQIALHSLIYQIQAIGGISRLYNECIPRICELDPQLQISFYASFPLRQPVPQHSRIRVVRLTDHNLRPARLWKHIRSYTDWLKFVSTLKQ